MAAAGKGKALQIFDLKFKIWYLPGFLGRKNTDFKAINRVLQQITSLISSR